MKEILALLLRVAGSGLALLAVLHIPIGRHLRWREESARLTPVNASIFVVHAFFICLVLIMMAAPCLFEPSIFLERSRAGEWFAWSFAGFWAVRLYCQWFVYRPELWRGKRLETALHWWFTIVWIALTGVFAACGMIQRGWL